MNQYQVVFTDGNEKEVAAESYSLNDGYFNFYGASTDAFSPNVVFTAKAALVATIEKV